MHRPNLRRPLLLVSLLCPLYFAALGYCNDWPKYRLDLANDGYSLETGINSTNVASLKLKWSFDSGSLITASPAVATVNSISTVYFGSWNGTFYALNAITGSKLWLFQIDPVSNCTQDSCTRIGSSPAVANGIVYFGAANGYFYALNAANGALVWKVQVGNPNNGYEVWSSPAIYNGLVYFGVASHTDIPCVIGQVLAKNATTGASVWSFTTLNQSTCPSGTCVGAGVWASPAIDNANNILYVGTGNPGSTCNPSTANASQYPDSILALNASNGALMNYFQANSNDTADLDFGSSPALHSTIYHNPCTNVINQAHWVTEANKSGKVYDIEIGPTGLTSTRYTTAGDGSNITASPAVFSASENVGTCTVNGHVLNITDYDNWVYAPTTAGNLVEIFLIPNEVYSTANWPVTTSAIYSAPALIEDVILFGGNDNKLHAVNSQGKLVWTFSTGNGVASGPAISNGRVYFGSEDHKLYCLSINGQ